jgi:hypothetical protein
MPNSLTRAALRLLPVCYVLLPLLSFAQDSTPLFLLKRSGDVFAVEKVQLTAGQTQVFDCGGEEGIIDAILPVGQGGSGSVVQLGEAKVLIAQYDGSHITISVQTADGNRRALPSRAPEDLRHFDSRISVTSGDGATGNFYIRGYKTVVPDPDGPVMDMFAGKYPLQENDYSLYVDTYPAVERHSLTGSAPIEYSGRYLFASVRGPDGREGLFAVDIGASSTVVRKSFLPEGTDISEQYMTEYSTKGKKLLKYEPGGATGKISTILGGAQLPVLSFGEFAFKDADVDVISELPELHGRQIEGIIGLDLLRAARYLLLDYGTDGKAVLILSNEPILDKNAASVPFSTVRRIMYVKGEVNSRPVFFILDSGSPDCVLSPKSAQMVNLNVASDSSITYKGGGGQKWEGKMTKIPSIRLGEVKIDNQATMIGDIHVFQTLGEDQAIGLLGNSLFAEIGRLELDFDRNELRMKK